jgi:hypothetical protein
MRNFDDDLIDHLEAAMTRANARRDEDIARTAVRLRDSRLMAIDGPAVGRIVEKINAILHDQMDRDFIRRWIYPPDAIFDHAVRKTVSKIRNSTRNDRGLRRKYVRWFAKQGRFGRAVAAELE